MAQKTIVGLDIGTNTLRAVEVLRGSQPQIIGIASLSLDRGVVEKGEVKNHIALAEALKQLWKIGKFTARDVKVVFNSENNSNTLMSFNDETDFSKTLPFRLNAMKEGGSTTDSYISYHTLRKYEVQEVDPSVLEGFKTVPKRDIFISTVKRQLVDNILHAFARTDFRVLSIDLAPLAMIRGDMIDTPVDPLSKEENVNIHVNIGGATSTLTITNNAQPEFVRISSAGTNLIDNEIEEELGVSPEEAQRLKIKTLTMNPSLFQRESNAGTIFANLDEQPTPDNERYTDNEIIAYEIVNDLLNGVIQDISSGIAYFINRNEQGLGEYINNIFVSGAPAAFGKIRHHLSLETGAENTVLSQPFSNMQKKNLIAENLVEQFYAVQHEYNIAVGAVLGNGGNADD